LYKGGALEIPSGFGRQETEVRSPSGFWIRETESDEPAFYSYASALEIHWHLDGGRLGIIEG
jgi:hypothetical protein